MKRVKSRQMPLRTLALSLGVVVAATMPASAQAPAGSPTVSEDMLACAAIEEDATRLACYDRAMGPLLGENGGEDAVHTFVGNSDWTSDAVQMDRPWHVAWRSTAALLNVELRTAEGIFISVAGSQIGEGEGQSATFEPGDYRISVTAISGDWRLILVEE